MKAEAIPRQSVVIHVPQALPNPELVPLRAGAQAAEARLFEIEGAREDLPERRRSIDEAGALSIDNEELPAAPPVAPADPLEPFDRACNAAADPGMSRRDWLAVIRDSAFTALDAQQAPFAAATARRHAAALVARGMKAWDGGEQGSSAGAARFTQIVADLLNVAIDAACKCEPEAVRQAELAGTYQACLDAIRGGATPCALGANRIAELIGEPRAIGMKRDVIRAFCRSVDEVAPHAVFGSPELSAEKRQLHADPFRQIWGADPALVAWALDHVVPGALLGDTGKRSLLRQMEVVCIEALDSPGTYDSWICELALRLAREAPPKAVDGDRLKAHAVRASARHVVRQAEAGAPDREAQLGETLARMLPLVRSIGDKALREKLVFKHLLAIAQACNLEQTVKICRELLALGAERKTLEAALETLLARFAIDSIAAPAPLPVVLDAAVFSIIVDRLATAKDDLGEPLRYPPLLQGPRDLLRQATGSKERGSAKSQLTEADWDRLLGVLARELAETAARSRARL